MHLSVEDVHVPIVVGIPLLQRPHVRPVPSEHCLGNSVLENQKEVLLGCQITHMLALQAAQRVLLHWFFQLPSFKNTSIAAVAYN